MVGRKLVPPNLQNTMIDASPSSSCGFVSGPLSTPAARLWENAWAAVESA